MTLTQTSRLPRSNDAFPTTQLFILSICRVAEPIALTSIFPYSWLMVKSFHVGEAKDASFYAGILISAFSLAESLTGMLWGGLSDRIGRKPVLLLGCFGTVLSLLIVGFSRSFTVALLGRILGGLLNGNIGVIQTMVGELVKNPEHEPKAYSVMPFVWSIGTIIGPAVGGTLANPAQGFPDLFPEGSFFDVFPWLLPNLVCAIFMCFSMAAAYWLLEETHPDLQQDANPYIETQIAEQTPMIVGAGTTADPGVDLRQESYGTFNEVEISKVEEWEVASNGAEFQGPQNLGATKWFTWKVAMLVLCLGIYTYHVLCYDHLLPIFLQESRAEDVSSFSNSGFLHIPGGLGLTTKTVGLIMSVNGLIALFVQAVVFPFLTDRLGVWRTFMMVTLFHPIAYFIVPYLTLLPEILLFPGIYACLTVRNFFTILQYPLILILLKQASVSPSFLGRINGLAASVGAASRTVSPPVTGLVYGLGLDIGFTGLAWWFAGFIALIGGFQLYFIPREKNNSTVIKSIAPCLASTTASREQPADTVKITVIET